jgi:hypothetical protein
MQPRAKITRDKVLTVRIKQSVLDMLIEMQGKPDRKTKRCPLSMADIVESLVEQAYVEGKHGQVLKP